MIRRFVAIFSTLFIAFAILFLSILRAAAVRYEFAGVKTGSPQDISRRVEELESMEIKYYLPHPGAVLPGHVLWPLKALRDKIWLAITTSPAKKSELTLLFADKRLGAAKIFFERAEDELGYVTLTKAEKYLEEACNLEGQARAQGYETTELAERLINASLKHRQVIDEILLIAPDDAKPEIVLIQNYSRGVYDRKSEVLKSKGVELPKNPFDGE
jgi:hypothetical protein